MTSKNALHPTEERQDDRLVIASWNVNFRPARMLRWVLPLRPDILVLREVTREREEEYRSRLAGHRLGLHYSGRSRARTKRYGNLIASRWPLRTLDLPSNPRSRRERKVSTFAQPFADPFGM
jgi:endonuclease/exonuclease/phosphatase family metal-dependent hydrolase